MKTRPSSIKNCIFCSPRTNNWRRCTAGTLAEQSSPFSSRLRVNIGLFGSQEGSEALNRLTCYGRSTAYLVLWSTVRRRLYTGLSSVRGREHGCANRPPDAAVVVSTHRTRNRSIRAGRPKQRDNPRLRTLSRAAGARIPIAPAALLQEIAGQRSSSCSVFCAIGAEVGRRPRIRQDELPFQRSNCYIPTGPGYHLPVPAGFQEMLNGVLGRQSIPAIFPCTP